MFKASIIIPYYRKKTYIAKTLKSVLKQTYKNFEIIIIYDDEDKADLKFIKKLKKLDSKRIRLIINNKNLGAGAARNLGISLSRGQYICFIDADDIWKKNKLSSQLAFMIRNNYLITHTSYQIQNEKSLVVGLRRAKTFRNLDQLLPSCDIGLSTVIVKKQIFSNMIKFPNLKTKEDFELWLKILKSGNYIHSFDKVLVKWTKSKNSLSSSILQKIKDSFLVYNKFMKFNPFKSIYYTILLSINFLKKNFYN